MEGIKQPIGLHGVIYVEDIIKHIWRLEHQRIVRLWDAIEEREALKWWHKASTDTERAQVERIYGTVLAHWSQRRKHQGE